MRTTVLTVRADESMRQALEERARESGMSMSEVVRDILSQALEERPLGERVGHLRGTLSSEGPESGWRRQLRERNWR